MGNFATETVVVSADMSAKSQVRGKSGDPTVTTWRRWRYERRVWIVRLPGRHVSYVTT